MPSSYLWNNKQETIRVQCPLHRLPYIHLECQGQSKSKFTCISAGNSGFSVEYLACTHFLTTLAGIHKCLVLSEIFFFKSCLAYTSADNQTRLPFLSASLFMLILPSDFTLVAHHDRSINITLATIYLTNT